MSDTSQTPGTQTPRTPQAQAVPRQRQAAVEEPTGWVGWIAFAGIVAIMLGAFQAIAGLVALFQSDYYLVTESDMVVNVSYDTWGWTHLALGVLLAGTGFGMLAGQTWARVVGVLLAGLSSLVNIVFLPAYPLWSLIMITLNILVIYALVVHGREMKAPSVY